MKHSVDPSNVKPCRHMEGLVSALVDDSLVGVARWYTQFHVRSCPHCLASLAFLNLLKGRLAALPGGEQIDAPSLSADRWATVNAAWDRLDREREA